MTCMHVFCIHAVYKQMSEAVTRHPEADVLVNFASLRSAFEATVEAMEFNKVHGTCMLSICAVVIGLI